MDAARGVKGHGWALYAGPRNEDGMREVERSETRMQGQAFLLTFLAFEKSEAPSRAKPEVRGASSAAPYTNARAATIHSRASSLLLKARGQWLGQFARSTAGDMPPSVANLPIRNGRTGSPLRSAMLCGGLINTPFQCLQIRHMNPLRRCIGLITLQRILNQRSALHASRCTARCTVRRSPFHSRFR